MLGAPTSHGRPLGFTEEGQYTEVKTIAAGLLGAGRSDYYQGMAHHGQRVPEAVFLDNFFYILLICLVNHWSLSPESGHTFGKLAFEFGAVCQLDAEGGGKEEIESVPVCEMREGMHEGKVTDLLAVKFSLSCDDFKQVSQSL